MLATTSRRLCCSGVLLRWTKERMVHLKASQPAIKEVIQTNNVVVFSKTYCPFCERAKALFEDLEAEAEVLELDECDDGGKVQNLLTDLTGKSTVPYVFIKGKFVGGYDDVIGLHAQRKLESLVNCGEKKE